MRKLRIHRFCLSSRVVHWPCSLNPDLDLHEEPDALWSAMTKPPTYVSCLGYLGCVIYELATAWQSLAFFAIFPYTALQSQGKIMGAGLIPWGKAPDWNGRCRFLFSGLIIVALGCGTGLVASA